MTFCAVTIRRAIRCIISDRLIKRQRSAGGGHGDDGGRAENVHPPVRCVWACGRPAGRDPLSKWYYDSAFPSHYATQTRWKTSGIRPANSHILPPVKNHFFTLGILTLVLKSSLQTLSLRKCNNHSEKK